tara:strand:- start:14 stop:2896 length:2883 start_codon:yes stop_codon:yes gene_type:complete
MALKELLTDLTQGLASYPNHNTPSTSGGFNYGSSTSIFDNKIFRQRGITYKNRGSRQDNPVPLIPQLLPGVNQEPSNSILYLDDSPDGFLRGGIMNTVKRAAFDNIRMNRFFKTGEGISFIEVQKSLQKTNPIIQEGGGNLNNVFEDVLNMGLGTNSTSHNTNRTFNEGNLIKQISEGGFTGVYYNRAGANPTIQADEQNKYFESHKPGRNFDANKMGEFNKQGGLKSGNRLVSLGKKLDVGLRTGVNGNHGINFAMDGQESLMHQAVGFDVGDIMDTWSSLKAGFNNFMSNPLESLSQPGPFSPNQEIGFKPGENVIYQYSGGPGSTYGVGDTILYRYERTSGDYDHQGHPLSIETYNKHKHTTIIGNELIFFNKDGSLNSDVALNYLADTFNDNLFGGNNILGENGLLFGDNFNLNSPSNILSGLANQVFGEDTVNFVTDLFNGGGVGNPTQGPVTIGSYIINDIQLIDGSRRKDPILNKSINGFPTSGFIEGYSSPTGKGFGNKPDDVALSIENGLSDNLPLGVGKVISHYATMGHYNPQYQPTLSEIIAPYSGKGKTIKVAKGVDGNYTRESRLGMGNPGLHLASAGIDQINALDIHTVDGDNYSGAEYRDLVRFRFEAIQTDNPSASDVMVFRAFLDNFGDNFSSQWNAFKYNGRGEEFFTYGGFKRSFKFNFKVAAQSREEMKPLYRKLNYLVSNLAPDYANNGRMRAPYIKLCVGAYMDRTPGFLTSMNISWKKDYPWEIAIDSPEGGVDTSMHVLPHVLDVSCGFTPIHDFVPRKSVEESPFIIPGKDSGLNKGKPERRWLSGDNSEFEPKTPILPPVDTGEGTTTDTNVVTTDNKTGTGVDNNSTSDNLKTQGESGLNNQQRLTLLKSAADRIATNLLIPLDQAGTVNSFEVLDLDGDGNIDTKIFIEVSYNPKGEKTVNVKLDQLAEWKDGKLTQEMEQELAEYVNNLYN